MSDFSIQSARRADWCWWTSIAIYVVVGLLAAYRFTGPMPRSARIVSGVSSARALETLSVLLGEEQKPHRAGLPENEQLRVRLLGLLDELGVQTWVLPMQIPKSGQERLARSKLQLEFTSEMANIVGRMEGKPRARPVVLATHYDSNAISPGAGDAGQCVAAILEAVRALKSQPLEYEVWLLLTDAEEFGLWGSQAFIEQGQFPWGVEKPVVISFDARGCRGAALLYETHDDNLHAMQLASSAIASPPVSNSLMVAVYKMLPNGTDFTTYRQAGWCGWNFAVVAGADRYHTENDNLANLSPRSVQHFAGHAYGLLQKLDRLTPDQLNTLDRSQPAVFFDVLGFFLVVYPASMNLWQWLLMGGLWVVAWPMGRGQLRWLRVLGVWLGTIVATAISSGVGMAIVLGLQAADFLPRNFVQHYEWLVLLFPIAAGAIVFGMARMLAAVASRWELLSGVTLSYLVLSGLTCWWLPGGAYLFLWPGLALAVQLVISLKWPAVTVTNHTWIGQIHCLVPALLYAPTYVLLAQALGPRSGMLIAAAACLMLLPTSVSRAPD